ncbi:hypothetical protein N7471_013919 [Penicillium samsonianum]|uniref:uncharacterized protein n=1 Tax=Penicillium samsonianum TaxID=1882272 RepID=UPI002547125E|nr:uncharacterized protein N7471_013919 [Penicillium samsonianum]KAJ6118042.1 hypothetical protein N7471_013919 [Penicillium samsonianum]
MGAIECSTLDYTDKEKKDKAANLRWGALILDGIKYLEKECEAHFEESERQELRCYKEILGHKNAEDTENSGKSGKATALPSLLRAAAFLRTKLVNCHRLPDWLELQFSDLYDEYIGQDKENGQTKENAVLDSIRELYKAGARIITTNYDDVLSRHCKTGTIILNDENTLRRFFAKTDPLRGILHVHGLWSDPAVTVLDPGDYNRVASHSFLQPALRSCFNGPEVLLFVGAEGGLNDPNFGHLLDWADKELENLTKRHYIFMRNGEKNVKLSLKEVRYGKDYDDLPAFLKKIVIDSRGTNAVISSPGSLSAESCMLTSAFKGENEETLRLVNSGANMNAKDMYGCTALHMAAYRGDETLARQLIAAGAAKDIRDLMNETPAEMAERLNKNEVAKIIKGTQMGSREIKVH